MLKHYSIIMFTFDKKIDRRILLQAKTLREHGLTVAIIAMTADIPEEDGADVFRIDQFKNKTSLANILLVSFKKLKKLLPINSWIIKKLRSAAMEYVFDHEHFILPLYLPAIKQLSADVYVAHDLPMLPIAYKAAKLRNAKLVYDSHEFFTEQEFTESIKRKWQEIETKYISACHLTITVNQSIAQELASRYKLKEVYVILNAENTEAVDAKFKYFHKTFSLDETDKVLLFQGTFATGRNVQTLIDAFKLINNSKIHLVLMGEGDLKNELISYVKVNGLCDRIHFHEAVPQKVLLNYTAAADGGIIPYTASCLNNYYCTPNKLFEFIAAETPILANNLPELKKIITEHTIGAIGDLNTSELMAEAIETFFANESELQLWKKNISLTKKQINWEVEGKKLIDAYTQNEIIPSC